MFTGLEEQVVQAKKVWHLTFITPPEMSHLKAIEKMTKQSMKVAQAPSYQDALKGQQDQAMQTMEQTSGNRKS